MNEAKQYHDPARTHIFIACMSVAIDGRLFIGLWRRFPSAIKNGYSPILKYPEVVAVSWRYRIIGLAMLPLVVAILAVTALTAWQAERLVRSSIDTFEEEMLKSKEEELANLTSIAMSAIQQTYADAAANDEEARNRVASILKSLDYGKDGYFFVYDYDGNSIVHPRQNELPGRNWLDLIDPDGKKVIANLIATAKAGGGFFQYKWERPATGRVGDKLSYVVGLEKWRWMVGTGVYLDNVFAQTATAKAELRQRIVGTFSIVTLVAIPATVLVFSACMLIMARERRVADDKLQQLTRRVIDAQEEERGRLARELHDGISQNLVAVRYACDLAARKARSGAADADTAIDAGIETLNGAIKEIRRLSHELRPRVLDDLGLAAALTALCNNFAERTGIDTSLDAAAFADDLKPEASTALYRIVQEALTNIERHSGAGEARIRIWSAGGRAKMTITDNGRGFDGGAEKGGLGLRNMQERMAHLGGILLIKSGSDGTQLTAMLPKTASAKQKAPAA